MKKSRPPSPPRASLSVTVLTKHHGAWSDREKEVLRETFNCGIRTHSDYPNALVLLGDYPERLCKAALNHATAFTHQLFPSRDSPPLPFSIPH